jgi:CheY-like chemotaxis protein
MLGRRLERAGYTTILAEGGREGLEIIDRQPIDLVLLDIMMPDFNGIETLQAIRAKYSMAQLPVIMATAKDSSEDMLQAFDLGASDYVTKPIDLPIVLARIQSHLRLIQSAQEQSISAQPLKSKIAPIASTNESILPQVSSPKETIVDSILDLHNVSQEPIEYSNRQKLSAIAEPETKLLLGRYRNNGKLVRDRVRDVYLVQDTQSPEHHTYLLQLIKLDLERPSLRVAAIYQFQREIQLFNEISQHPNIINIVETFKQEQHLCIIQEYIGEDLLSRKLNLNLSLGIANGLTLIIEMLEILQEFHQREIEHQHLDANCFAYNADCKLTLVDLGISTRLLHKFNSIASQPANLDWVLTQSSDRSSDDIYAIGTIAIHALTGISVDRLPLNPLTGELNWRNSCIVAESFAKILNKMVCKNTENRYTEIATILKDLYQLPMVAVLLKPSLMLK